MKTKQLAVFAVVALSQLSDAKRVPYFERAKNPNQIGWFQGSTYQAQDRHTKLD